MAIAQFGPLRDQGAAYADRLKNAGGPAEYPPGRGLIHGFVAFLGGSLRRMATSTQSWTYSAKVGGS